MDRRGADDVALLTAARAGDEDAFVQLEERWLDRVHDVARRIVGDRDAAEVTADVFVLAWRQLDTAGPPEGFGSWLVRTAAHRALDRLEWHRRSLALGQMRVVGRADDLAAAGDDELVRAVAAAVGDRDASILHLHLRHGLAGDALAEELATTPEEADHAMFLLRSRLGNAIRAWVLWRRGHPDCEGLDALLRAGSTTTFNRSTVRTITAHAVECDRCSHHRATVAPGPAFAAVPIAAAPAGVRAQVAEALRRAGVATSSAPVPDAGEG